MNQCQWYNIVQAFLIHQKYELKVNTFAKDHIEFIDGQMMNSQYMLLFFIENLEKINSKEEQLLCKHGRLELLAMSCMTQTTL